MALIDILATQVTSLLQAFNNMNANARKTSEFPLQTPLENTSLIRVEDSLGISKHVSINQIIDKATSYLSNELLYFSGITVVGNTVTLSIGSVWRINSVVYSNATTKVFTVPFAGSGAIREDILVGDNLNNVTKITGNEDDVLIKPPVPNDKVIVCELKVTETTISIIKSNGSVPTPESISFNVAIAGTQNFTIPDGAICYMVHVVEGFVARKDAVSNGWINNWEQVGTTITLKKSTVVGQRIHISYNV